MSIIGIDPGMTGAIAFNEDSNIEFVENLPFKDNKINVLSLSEFLLEEPKARHIFIEQPIYMPKQSSQSTATTAGNYERILAIIEWAEIPYTEVRASEWKKTMDISLAMKKVGKKATPKEKSEHKKALKELAIKRAHQLFPGIVFGNNDGMAEAALISEYGRRVLAGKE
jgi:hypothetical protein